MYTPTERLQGCTLSAIHHLYALLQGRDRDRDRDRDQDQDEDEDEDEDDGWDRTFHRVRLRNKVKPESSSLVEAVGLRKSTRVVSCVVVPPPRHASTCSVR
ncbi:hypothetical protein F2P81_004167 [Scophthalmus maximus]|uniref:Uncharacterized protein n=1 Tax=Scophthalmus maximus TaxID=52904 RepID=A0A6A4TGD8_SCOMX|nr:hypothetical protein F2P81_004167 [Scophthalmus maximus]